MRVLKIKHGDDGRECVLALKGAREILAAIDVVAQETETLIDERSVGDTVILSLDEMTDEEIASLPEFQGW